MSRYVANVDLDALAVRPGDHVADVGCGEGALAEMLARAGLRVTGVEPAAYLRERAQARLAAVAADNRAVDGTGERLPFADGELDAATITEVLEHVADPAAIMSELHRVVRPGGVVCVSVPTSYTELLFWRLHPGYADNATHVRIFAKPELAKLVRTAGFEVVRWEGRNFRAAARWVVHALLRTPSDHAGVLLGNAFADKLVLALFHGLDVLGLGGLADTIGNRVWAKSWYVYCRRV